MLRGGSAMKFYDNQCGFENSITIKYLSNSLYSVIIFLQDQHHHVWPSYSVKTKILVFAIAKFF